MNLTSRGREARSKTLVALFVSAALMMSVAGAANAAPLAKCQNDPENFQLVTINGTTQCLSDDQVEKLTNKGQL